MRAPGSGCPIASSIRSSSTSRIGNGPNGRTTCRKGCWKRRAPTFAMSTTRSTKNWPTGISSSGTLSVADIALFPHPRQRQGDGGRIFSGGVSASCTLVQADARPADLRRRSAADPRLCGQSERPRFRGGGGSSGAAIASNGFWRAASTPGSLMRSGRTAWPGRGRQCPRRCGAQPSPPHDNS